MPGSTLQLVLTGFLTIFIALIGYNLLLGQSLTVRGATLAFVKIGAVFALATSWPAYRTIVYDLVTDGPSQLVSELGPRAGVVGSDGTLLYRLDRTDHALAQLSILGPGIPPAIAYEQIPPAPFGGFDSFALGGSRIVFLLTATASLAIVRIVTGLMLALGPFFIAFLLFDATRSLFEGWVRVLGGAALAAIGVAFALGLELALMEPWLGIALARRMAGEALPTMPTELLVIVCLFSILVFSALYGCARVARAFRLPRVVHDRLAKASPAKPLAWPSAASGSIVSSAVSKPERTRAAALASLIRSTTNRERTELLAGASHGPVSRTVEVRADAAASSRTVPLGLSFSRRPSARVSAIAARRDA
jgi:type IV secretion system protein VirB6